MRALKRPEGINVVPLIDVMLVLLAIVLTISTFVASGAIKLDLPKAASAQTVPISLNLPASQASVYEGIKKRFLTTLSLYWIS